MIAVPRRLVRRFRTVSARCVTGRPRGPAPCVVLRRCGGRVTLTAAFPDVTLELAAPAQPTRDRDEVLVVPMGALEAVEGPTDEPVEFAIASGTTGTARWAERGAPRSVPVTFVVPGRPHDPLPRPREPAPVPDRLLTALHEAGRTAPREDGRYALSRVQVRGGAGQVVATDGKVAVVFGGFRFPFRDDVLVPAVPLFGCPDLGAGAEVRVGRTAAHLVVCGVDWTVWLTVAAGKYPDVSGAIPRPAPTTATLDEADAALLVRALPELPGRDHEHRPVTLRADETLAVCAGDGGTGPSRAVRLPRSRVSGPPARAVLDRRVLVRALGLGCRAVRFAPDKALVLEGTGVTVLAAPLDPALGTGPETPAESRTPDPPVRTPEPERSEPMTGNGRDPAGRGAPPAPPPDVPDPLIAAEELRAALGEALGKAGRLVAALKAGRKEKKALAHVYAGLKQLNLGPDPGRA